MAIADFSQLTRQQCQSARISRDVRFDGHFFVAVKTTGIFCRPICPATTPKEENVEYFNNHALALNAGYRPCLRCRPDSAPGSWAWKGVETTFQRAIKLIEQGELQQTNLVELAGRLGISDRYLRQLFQQYLGMSPKQYAQYKQLMFAKQLLHTSSMSVAQIAIASGFNSVRRFNDAFQKVLKLTPLAIRKEPTDTVNQKSDIEGSSNQQLMLAYRPPFSWQHLLDFYRLRAIEGIEEVGDNYYRRTFSLGNAKGWFKAQLAKSSSGARNCLAIEFELDDITQLKNLVGQIRRLFDLDADIAVIEQHLSRTAIKPILSQGTRIPGVWNTWEAGIRAILGQQISVKAAITQLNRFALELGHRENGVLYFPTPQTVARQSLEFLKMPQSRKDTVKRFAEYMSDNFDADPQQWLALKGIGPWTVSYARLRGLSQPNCFLATDLVIKKVVAAIENSSNELFDPESVSPWGSYATFNCWNSQS